MYKYLRKNIVNELVETGDIKEAIRMLLAKKEVKECNECKGSGLIDEDDDPTGDGWTMPSVKCDACKGTGKTTIPKTEKDKKCSQCQGKGRWMKGLSDSGFTYCGKCEGSGIDHGNLEQLKDIEPLKLELYPNCISLADHEIEIQDKINQLTERINILSKRV